jgi:hypothetical protein
VWRGRWTPAPRPCPRTASGPLARKAIPDRNFVRRVRIDPQPDAGQCALDAAHWRKALSERPRRINDTPTTGDASRRTCGNDEGSTGRPACAPTQAARPTRLDRPGGMHGRDRRSCFPLPHPHKSPRIPASPGPHDPGRLPEARVWHGDGGIVMDARTGRWPWDGSPYAGADGIGRCG